MEENKAKKELSPEELDKVLRKNMEDSIARARRRMENGKMTQDEFNQLCDFEKKNYESGGRLYAERLAKALTPSWRWKW